MQATSAEDLQGFQWSRKISYGEENPAIFWGQTDEMEVNCVSLRMTVSNQQFALNSNKREIYLLS